MLGSEKTADAYRLVRSQVTKAQGGDRQVIHSVAFWCMSPDVVFGPMAAACKSIILTSGTLSPMDTFASELRTKFDTRMDAMHIVDAKQVWVGAIPMGPQGVKLTGVYRAMDSLDYQDELGRVILAVVEQVPYGVLCFVPSYAFQDKLLNRMDDTGMMEQIRKFKAVFVEPRATGSPKQFESLMREYYESIADCRRAADQGKPHPITGALFFAVYRGKVSEGLDLVDDNCRAVLPIGIPFPALTDQKVMLKREYNDAHAQSHGLLPGQRWYEIQAMRALNQALGRCIRHRWDWGAILLLDSRFTETRMVAQLPRWVRVSLQTNLDYPSMMTGLQQFMQINNQSIIQHEPNTVQTTNGIDEALDRIEFGQKKRRLGAGKPFFTKKKK